MPSVSLEVQYYANVAVPTLSGTVHLPQRRIVAWAYFGRMRKMYPAVIDTGAPACVLPSRVWTKLDSLGDIAWLGGTDPVSGFPRIRNGHGITSRLHGGSGSAV